MAAVDASQRRGNAGPAKQEVLGVPVGAVGAGVVRKATMDNGPGSRRAPPKVAAQRPPTCLVATRFSPQPKEVVAAVESLYTDGLKPYGRILRKRLTERALIEMGRPIDSEDAPDVDIRHLRAICNTCNALRVDSEEGGDWSAVLVGRPQKFINIYSPDDLYSQSLWDAALAYFESLEGEEMVLPGGRYACAQVLKSRNLDFLKDLSLGEICHVVQLAISQKKVLGYLNGAVVPYSRSQSMVKERCAESQRPCSGVGRETPGLPLATWDLARACLKDILASAVIGPGPGTVPLSNVKRLFRSRYDVELSETMLGHSKLSELLQDERFSDICRVRLEGHGYIVMQHGPGNHYSEMQACRGNLLASTPAFIPSGAMHAAAAAAAARVAACRPRPSPLSAAALFGEDALGPLGAGECGLARVMMPPPSTSPIGEVSGWMNKNVFPSPAHCGVASLGSTASTTTSSGEVSHFSSLSNPPSPDDSPVKIVLDSSRYGGLETRSSPLSVQPPPGLLPPPGLEVPCKPLLSTTPAPMAPPSFRSHISAVPASSSVTWSPKWPAPLLPPVLPPSATSVPERGLV